MYVSQITLFRYLFCVLQLEGTQRMCFCYVMLRPQNHRQQMMDCILLLMFLPGAQGQSE